MAEDQEGRRSFDNGPTIAQPPHGLGNAGCSGLDRVFVKKGVSVMDELVHGRVDEFMLWLPRVDVNVAVSLPAITEGRPTSWSVGRLRLAEDAEREMRFRVTDGGRVRLGAGLAHRRAEIGRG